MAAWDNYVLVPSRYNLHARDLTLYRESAHILETNGGIYVEVWGPWEWTEKEK